MLESRRECREAQKLLGMIKTAFPEVLTAIKTKQLAQEILLNKEEHIGEVEKTGGAAQPDTFYSCPLQCCTCRACYRTPTQHMHCCIGHRTSHDRFVVPSNCAAGCMPRLTWGADVTQRGCRAGG